MSVLRVPDECFHSLPDYPFAPRYLMLDGMRLHYLQEEQGDRIGREITTFIGA